MVTPRFEFFCYKECKNEWYSKIPQDAKEKGNKAFRQLSDTMNSEEFKRGLLDGLNRISKLFKKRIT